MTLERRMERRMERFLCLFKRLFLILAEKFTRLKFLELKYSILLGKQTESNTYENVGITDGK